MTTTMMKNRRGGENGGKINIIKRVRVKKSGEMGARTPNRRRAKTKNKQKYRNREQQTDRLARQILGRLTGGENKI